VCQELELKCRSVSGCAFVGLRNVIPAEMSSRSDNPRWRYFASSIRVRNRRTERHCALLNRLSNLLLISCLPRGFFKHKKIANRWARGNSETITEIVQTKQRPSQWTADAMLDFREFSDHAMGQMQASSLEFPFKLCNMESPKPKSLPMHLIPNAVSQPKAFLTNQGFSEQKSKQRLYLSVQRPAVSDVKSKLAARLDNPSKFIQGSFDLANMNDNTPRKYVSERGVWERKPG